MKIADKRHVVVKLPGLPELQLLIVKRMPATPDMTAPSPAPGQK
jgi:hypothetical protein